MTRPLSDHTVLLGRLQAVVAHVGVPGPKPWWSNAGSIVVPAAWRSNHALIRFA
jgi:hypothetical protein